MVKYIRDSCEIKYTKLAASGIPPLTYTPSNGIHLANKLLLRSLACLWVLTLDTVQVNTFRYPTTP